LVVGRKSGPEIPAQVGCPNGLSPEILEKLGHLVGGAALHEAAHGKDETHLFFFWFEKEKTLVRAAHRKNRPHICVFRLIFLH
jgi:hypothetical protein